MKIDAKILLSWDPEFGLPAKTLEHAMASVKNGHVNVARHYRSLVLVWSADEISQEEATAAVEYILSSDGGEPE